MQAYSYIGIIATIKFCTYIHIARYYKVKQDMQVLIEHWDCYKALCIMLGLCFDIVLAKRNPTTSIATLLQSIMAVATCHMLASYTAS